MSTGRSPRSARLSAIDTPDGPAPITTTLTAVLRAGQQRGSATVTKVTARSGKHRAPHGLAIHPQPGGVLPWRISEQPPVFAIELRWAVVADVVSDARDVAGIGDQQGPGMLKSDPLLELQR